MPQENKKPTKRQLQKVATRMGYRVGLESYQGMYTGESYNTFGYIGDSVWVISILVTHDNLIRGG